MLSCRVFGHLHRFRADGPTMTWSCERCGDGGAKTYPDPEAAARYAAAFDQRDDPAAAGRGSLSLLPLRIIQRLRRR